MNLKITLGNPPDTPKFPRWLKSVDGSQVVYATNEQDGVSFTNDGEKNSVVVCTGGSSWEECNFIPCASPFSLHITP